jgi:Na+/H+ antiporter NhaD/arsenite permease-like protein
MEARKIVTEFEDLEEPHMSRGSFIQLMVLLCILVIAIMNALLDNDTTMLLIVPVMIGMCNLFSMSTMGHTLLQRCNA